VKIPIPFVVGARVTGLVVVSLLVSAGNLHSCTLWGASGKAASGGTIMSKNRDWAPDHSQELKMRRIVTGYAYFGLYAVGGTEPGLKAGVNEKGLSVITAAAGSIPKSLRDRQPGKQGVISRLLSELASCDEVLAKKEEIFSRARAMFVMIADRKKILVVEVGLDGKYALKTVEDGIAVHTNHFLERSLSEFNVKVGSSSAKRLQRITELMTMSPRPFTTELFVAMSRDQNDGPDNSLWRTGKSSRTLASWIIEIPSHGDPKLRVMLANPGEPERTRDFVLNETFWKETP